MSGLKSFRLRWLLLALLAVLAGCAAFSWATHVDPAPNVPMDEVEFERSPTRPEVVRVLNAKTQHPYRCYELASSDAATAVLAVGAKSTSWNAADDELVASLATSSSYSFRAPLPDPTLGAYKGALTVPVLSSGTEISLDMASQTEADRFAWLLLHGEYATGQARSLATGPASMELTFTLELGTPLPASQCQ